MSEHDRKATPDRPQPAAWGFLFIMEGVGAREAGQSCSENPYPPGSEEADYWAEGWHEADAAQTTR
jgi:hypothetical protein